MVQFPYPVWKDILRKIRKFEAVLITSPTYDGVVSDVRKIAETAHKHGIPLIVDEAHGAHFRFSDYFPVSAADLGADVVIQSFHKTLPAMTQTAVLHLCSERVSEKLIRRFLGIYETSSPSYILMSSLDACVAKLEKTADDYLMNLRKIWKPPADSLVSAGIYVCYRHRKRLGKKRTNRAQQKYLIMTALS